MNTSPPASTPTPSPSTPPSVSQAAPSPLLILCALTLDLSAFVLIGLLAKWHTFSEGVTAGAFFTVLTGQVASKAGGARTRFQMPGIGVVLAFVSGAYTLGLLRKA